MNTVLEDIAKGRTSITNCAAGYLMTKAGRHGAGQRGAARETFQTCADQGYTGAMTWMAYLDNNGFGGAYNLMPLPIGTARPPRRAIPWGSSTMVCRCCAGTAWRAMRRPGGRWLMSLLVQGCRLRSGCRRPGMIQKR
jgi:hypothetical protein